MTPTRLAPIAALLLAAPPSALAQPASANPARVGADAQAIVDRANASGGGDLLETMRRMQDGTEAQRRAWDGEAGRRAREMQRRIEGAKAFEEQQWKERSDEIKRQQAALAFYVTRAAGAFACVGLVAALLRLLALTRRPATPAALAASDPWVRAQLARGQQLPPNA